MDAENSRSLARAINAVRCDHRGHGPDLYISVDAVDDLFISMSLFNVIMSKRYKSFDNVIGNNDAMSAVYCCMEEMYHEIINEIKAGSFWEDYLASGSDGMYTLPFDFDLFLRAIEAAREINPKVQILIPRYKCKVRKVYNIIFDDIKP